MKAQKFTIKQFGAMYPNDDACLDEIFQNRYGNISECEACKKKTKFFRVKKRKCYACEYCGFQIHPLAETVFHKSSTSLKDWFYAIYLFSVSKNGVSGKELERQLGVTYKTAWRIAKQIRILFEQPDSQFTKTVEVDETYVGGKAKGKRGRGADKKIPIIGIVEREGQISAKVVGDTKSSTIMPFIKGQVKVGSEVMTDEYLSYSRVSQFGYDHKRINHSKKQYVAGNVHTNTIEGFWSQLKRSINGTYHAVSPKYLQDYVNEFAYRYSNRNASQPLFFPLVLKAGKRV